MKEEETYPIMVRQPSGPPKILRINKEDKQILEAYIACGDRKKVAAELGISETKVRKLVSKDTIREYLANRVRHISERQDLTPEKVMAKLNEIVDGDGSRKFDPSYLKALDLAARIVKLVQPNSTNVNLNAHAGSPLSEMSDEEFDEAFKSRLGYDKDNLEGDKK